MIWKDIKNYEGIYQVSDKGNVKSLSRKRKDNGVVLERILKERFDKMGYVQYILYKNGIKNSFKGHHLVWDNFKEESRNGRINNIDHIDGNKSNNCLSNLRLTTNRENLSKGKLKVNKYGLTGVYKPKKGNKYQAYITIKGKHKYLGSFNTPLEAHNEYLKNIPCEN